MRERVTKAKGKTASDASGVKSGSEKSQPTGGKVSEKSHVTAVTRTSKNPFEASTGQKTQNKVVIQKHYG